VIPDSARGGWVYTRHAKRRGRPALQWPVVRDDGGRDRRHDIACEEAQERVTVTLGQAQDQRGRVTGLGRLARCDCLPVRVSERAGGTGSTQRR